MTYFGAILVKLNPTGFFKNPLTASTYHLTAALVTDNALAGLRIKTLDI